MSSQQIEGTHGPLLTHGGGWQSPNHKKHRTRMGHNHIHSREGRRGQYLGFLPHIHVQHVLPTAKSPMTGSLQLVDPMPTPGYAPHSRWRPVATTRTRTQKYHTGHHSPNHQTTTAQPTNIHNPQPRMLRQELPPSPAFKPAPPRLLGSTISNATPSHTLTPPLPWAPLQGRKGDLQAYDAATPRHANDDALIRNCDLLAADGPSTTCRHPSRNQSG